MFGQTGSTTFGFNASTQSSPFGQSAFGKPIATTNFGTGATPVFGSSATLFSSKPAGSTTGGLFGNTTATPAFGQPTTTQSSFGTFGNTSTNTSLFGTQQNANANPFGTTAPAFGQANKPGTFGFGSTTGTSLFGQTQPATQQPTPFGQPNTAGSTGLFGNSGGFGGTNTAGGMTGTVVKFTPVTGTDTVIKNSVSQTISTRHHCITCMKEYESKSLEELRLEDYMAGRKGTVQGQTGGLFGASTQPAPFGTAATGSTPSPGFGSMTGGFGATSQPGATGLFSKSLPGFGAPTTTTSAFAFNTTTTPSLFGSSSQPKPFGATAGASLFSTTGNTQTPSTGFGALNTTQSTGFGNFGSTQPNQSIGLFSQNKPAFSVPASTSSTGFGAFTTQANTGTSLFAQNKPAGTTGFGTAPAFGTPAANTFGSTTGFGANQGTNTSLFNSHFKPAGTTPGFSFGNTSGTTTGLGTNTGLGLGSGTNLFGQQKPGGLFGSTGTGSTFNNTGTFGSGPSFGANTSTMPSLGMNMLGGGLGSNQNQPSSGSVPVHQQILALVSAPFGDSPLLKNLLPASGKAEELLKPTNPATKALNSPQYKISTSNHSPKIKPKAVTAGQLSKKSLFEGLEEEDPSLMEAFQPRPNAKRLVLRPKSVTNISVQNTSEDNVNVIRNMNDSEKSDTGGANISKNSDLEITNKENENHDGNRSSVERRSSSAWLKTAQPRKTNNDDLANPQSPFRGSDIQEESLENTVAELRPQSGKQNQVQSNLNQSTSLSPNVSLGIDKSTAESTSRDSDSGHELDETPLSSLQTEGESNAAKVKLRRAGYYTIPPLDKLDEYVRGETCVVPNFTVGRKGYGNVYFPDSFDIYGLDLDEIVHFRHKEVIIYPDDEKKPPVNQGLNRRAQVTLDRVWPHDKSLHKPITDLFRLAVMDYEGKLRRVSAKHDTRFLEYRPETGSWVFKVDHFSKYGLSDSDDEDNDVVNNTEAKKLKSSNVPQKTVGISKTLPLTMEKSSVKSGPQHIVAGLNGTLDDKSNGFSKHRDFESDMIDDELMTPFILPENEYNTEKQSALSPTSVYARIIGTDSHKLQLMKASFFDTNEDNIEEAVCGGIQRLLHKGHMLNVDEFMDDSHPLPMKVMPPLTRYHVKLQTDASVLDTKRFKSIEDTEIKKALEEPAEKSTITLTKVFPAPIVQPQTVVLKYKSEVIPFKDSIINKLRSRCIADSGIQMGRKFRPSWGPGLILISLSTREQASNIPLQNNVSQLGSYVSGRLFDDTTSMSIVQRLQILGGRATDCDYLTVFQESIEGHLRIQLDHCIMGQEGDCPMVGVQSGASGIAALHAHCNLAQDFVDKKDAFTTYASNVWKLCTALWGNLPDIEPTDDEREHKCVMVRKEALGEWLRSVVEENLQEEISELDRNEQIILFLLSANKLEEACEIARKSGDYCLALFISQLQGSTAVRDLVKQQLALWQETDVDSNLSIDRLKLFSLVAGEPLICSKQGTVNVCERFDWKRALALHLWYLSLPTASIADALELYEKSFDSKSEEAYAAEPRPDYFEEDCITEVSDKTPVYDLCFHLLKLYCTGNHSLEVLLNPMTHTVDPLDYRLSWLMQQTLVALGYSYLSTFAATLTHTNFATQLETYDMWHWAIFVLLHLEDTDRRRHAVRELLFRHVELSEDFDYVKRENFLREELGIPSMWINEAKAVKACAMKKYGEAAWYLIQAEQWNKAHEIIIEYLAADAIINENYEYLKSLLSPLIASDCNNAISGWAYQGQLLWDYIAVTAEIKSLLESTDLSGIGYKLELLQPQLTSLCTKINQFPCPTAKHRLCQAEISKRTLQLARSLLLLKSHDNASTGKVLFNLVSQLPLPEDYAQQELRLIINMRVNEIISN